MNSRWWRLAHNYPEFHNNPSNGIEKFTKKVKTHEENYGKLDFHRLGRLLGDKERRYYLEYCSIEQEDRECGRYKKETDLSIFRRDWYKNYLS